MLALSPGSMASRFARTKSNELFDPDGWLRNLELLTSGLTKPSSIICDPSYHMGRSWEALQDRALYDSMEMSSVVRSFVPSRMKIFRHVSGRSENQEPPTCLSLMGQPAHHRQSASSCDPLNHRLQTRFYVGRQHLWERIGSQAVDSEEELRHKERNFDEAVLVFVSQTFWNST
jgi:hypothetical protein